MTRDWLSIGTWRTAQFVHSVNIQDKRDNLFEKEANIFNINKHLLTEGGLQPPVNSTIIGTFEHEWGSE